MTMRFSRLKIYDTYTMRGEKKLTRVKKDAKNPFNFNQLSAESLPLLTKRSLTDGRRMSDHRAQHVGGNLNYSSF